MRDTTSPRVRRVVARGPEAQDAWEFVLSAGLVSLSLDGNSGPCSWLAVPVLSKTACFRLQLLKGILLRLSNFYDIW